MTKHERAIEAARELAEDREYYFDDGDLEAVVAAYLAVMREPAEDEVRVRVCVGVDEHGNWLVNGGVGMPDDYAADAVARAASPGWAPQFHFIEANVPAWRPPAKETVEGEVTK